MFLALGLEALDEIVGSNRRQAGTTVGLASEAGADVGGAVVTRVGTGTGVITIRRFGFYQGTRRDTGIRDAIGGSGNSSTKDLFL